MLSKEISNLIEEFKKIKESFTNIGSKIPDNWGNIMPSTAEADLVDAKMNVAMKKIYKRLGIWVFSIKTYDEFKALVKESNLNKNEKTYVFRRFWKTNMSKIDEALFCDNDNVTPNPDKKDKDWDFKIEEQIFDLKSTRIPNEFKYLEDELREMNTDNVDKFAEWLYKKQSGSWNKKAVSSRYNMQNRLFLVTIPLPGNEIETNFEAKANAISVYCKLFNLTDKHYYHDTSTNTDVRYSFLFIIERENEGTQSIIY